MRSRMLITECILDVEVFGTSSATQRRRRGRAGCRKRASQSRWRGQLVVMVRILSGPTGQGGLGSRRRSMYRRCLVATFPCLADRVICCRMATTKGADDMTLSDAFDGYRYEDTDPRPIHRVVMPTILSVFKKLVAQNGGTPLSVFDIGCGNGYAANVLSNNGCVVSGVDLSAHGVAQAKAAFPHLDVRVGSAYDDLPVVFGTFDAVLSLEVVEHLYSPHKLANSAFGLLRPGGSVVVSTPYHGYWKNLAISLANKWDSHFD